LFVDGLRFDVGQKLQERLHGRAGSVELTFHTAALPTVTATAPPPPANLLDAQRDARPRPALNAARLLPVWGAADVFLRPPPQALRRVGRSGAHRPTSRG
jgi:hypothetical protein